jgi:hypothetical protein
MRTMDNSQVALQHTSETSRRTEFAVCYREIPIADIVVEERIRHDPTRDIESLVSSIKACGLLHPITVRQQNGEEKYVLLAGERRLEACKRLGRESIEAMVHIASYCGVAIDERSPKQ